MSKIRGRNTVPERILRKALWSAGLRYRLRGNLKGKPDVIFVGRKVAVFVDGCFWHACPIHATKPKTNAEFWRKKILRNVERDCEVTHSLTSDGWVVLRFWEHEVERTLDDVVRTIASVVRTRP
jgi:DNA mismatch endonuclease (patch repair protein)